MSKEKHRVRKKTTNAFENGGETLAHRPTLFSPGRTVEAHRRNGIINGPVPATNTAGIGVLPPVVCWWSGHSFFIPDSVLFVYLRLSFGNGESSVGRSYWWSSGRYGERENVGRKGVPPVGISLQGLLRYCVPNTRPERDKARRLCTGRVAACVGGCVCGFLLCAVKLSYASYLRRAVSFHIEHTWRGGSFDFSQWNI